MRIKRLPDWRTRLHTFIEERRRTPFSEKNNCGMFLADAVNAMTGVDPAADLRGKFKNRAEGLVLLRRLGYEDLCSFIAANFEEIPPAFARYGDIMAFPTDETGWAGGIVNGERVTVLTTTAGLATVSREQALRAFKVP